MANDGQIVFEVTADGKAAIADIKELTKAIQQEAGKWDDAAKDSTDNIESSFSSMLKKVAAGVSAAKIGQELLNIGKAAISAASDLEEVQNVVDVTFGSDSSKIDTWAKNASTQFGLTETQAKKFTSTLGAMMKSAGLTGSEITTVSTDLSGLAADMASFYNLDFDTAFQKIRSGLSGETEPLKQLGINMSVANLNAFALQKGLSKTFEQMTQGEQTMLRYQYIMSATSDAQGDFSRTSDGYANSLRKMETNVESLKTKLGTMLIPTITSAVTWVNTLLETLQGKTETTTVLDEFASIDLGTEKKLAEIQSVKEEAETLASYLEEIYGITNREGDTQGQEAASVISKFGAKADETSKYLASLGLSSEEINEKQENWLGTCKKLVDTIPGLSSIINTETGEVKGGVQAVKDYVQAWSDGQTKLAMIGAYEQKESALSSKYADIPELRLDMALAEKRARDNRKKMDDILAKYHIGEEGVSLTWLDMDAEDIEAYEALLDLQETLDADVEKTTKEYNKQKDAYDEAKEALAEYKETIDEMPGSTEQAKTATESWLESVGKTSEEIQTLVSDAQTALQNLDDYVQGVRDSVATTIGNTVKGFDKIETNSSKMKDLSDKMAKLDTGSDEWKSLNDELSKLQGNARSAQNVAANLEQQAEYMDNYLKNMNAARSRGISNDVLSQLSDGSTDSYNILEALANASDSEVTRINDAYQSVIDKKKEMTTELTDQKLTVDQTYQSLADKAKEAVAELDLEQTAKDNAGKTVSGVAQGIADHVPEVQTAVDAILTQLNRLDGWGISIDFAGFGSVDFNGASLTDRAKGSERSFASGISYVPQDMYARIHEGEAVLTAQENQIWSMLRNGGINGVDLESLGGVMRDNIRPGGNVYLDGKAVGTVISDRQGRSYKSLQRSGWQA